MRLFKTPQQGTDQSNEVHSVLNVRTLMIIAFASRFGPQFVVDN
jgi:hypothetical protein